MLELTYAALALVAILAAFPASRALNLPRLLASRRSPATPAWTCLVLACALGVNAMLGLEPLGPITASVSFLTLAALALASTPHRANALTLARDSADPLRMTPTGSGGSPRARAA